MQANDIQLFRNALFEMKTYCAGMERTAVQLLTAQGDERASLKKLQRRLAVLVVCSAHNAEKFIPLARCCAAAAP